MPHKNKLRISKDQLRLAMTMLVLVIIGAVLLAAWSYRLKNISPLANGSFLPLSSPDKGVLVEQAITTLATDPELLLESSPDGRSFAYIERGEEGVRLVFNGEASPYYESITSFRFSPEGKSFAYTAKRYNKEFAVINGVEGRPYDWIFEPRTFSPDGRYFVYKARDSRGDMIVVNDRESRPYQRIYGLNLNPEKDGMSFFAREGKELWRGTIRFAGVTQE